MNTTSTVPEDRTPDRVRRELSDANISIGRRVRNRAATVAMAVAFLLAAGPLVLMAANVFSQGLPAVTNLDWWTQPIPADVGRADLAGNEQLQDLGFGDQAADPDSTASTDRPTAPTAAPMARWCSGCSPPSSAPS